MLNLISRALDIFSQELELLSRALHLLCWALDLSSWALEVLSWALDLLCWVLNLTCGALDVLSWALEIICRALQMISRAFSIISWALHSFQQVGGSTFFYFLPIFSISSGRNTFCQLLPNVFEETDFFRKKTNPASGTCGRNWKKVFLPISSGSPPDSCSIMSQVE